MTQKITIGPTFTLNKFWITNNFYFLIVIIFYIAPLKEKMLDSVCHKHTKIFFLTFLTQNILAIKSGVQSVDFIYTMLIPKIIVSYI